MPYAPIIPLIMGAGLGPAATLAHFSEVTQGKVGGGGDETRREGEIDFICFLFMSKRFSPPTPPNQQQPPPLLPTSPLYFRGETTDFLPAPTVCFSKRQYTSIYNFSMFRINQKPSEQIGPTRGCVCFYLNI